MSVYVFKVGGRDRNCPCEWWDCLIGPKPADDWAECDGCTCSPDYALGGFAIWPACRIHDFHYNVAAPPVTRGEADSIFRKNIYRCLRAQGCPWYRAAYTALVYWRAVRRFGASHYRKRREERLAA